MSTEQKCDSNQEPWPQQDKRFGVYEDGYYCKSFDTYEEAIAYAKKWLSRSTYWAVNDKEDW